MKKEPTLVIMAAGMGSRYGGLKQAEKMTDTGEIILDFSLYDAMMAGFNRAVFVIRREHRDVFKTLVDERAGRFLDVEYAYQDMEDIPEPCKQVLYKAHPDADAFTLRKKPWGTGHAIYACRDLIDGPFVVINADDYYGPSGFDSVYDFLTEQDDEAEVMRMCMVGYRLANTITEHGHVARGICEVDDNGYLTRITERTKIMQRPEGIAFTEDDGQTWTEVSGDSPVSMNFWGLSGGMMKALEEGLLEFFEKDVASDLMGSEYLLPTVIDRQIHTGKATVKVLPCFEKWCGVTYQDDKEGVVAALKSKKDKGLYPEVLWK